MEKTWVLVADGHRARCFERHAPDFTLTEVADFVHTYSRTNISTETSLGDRSGDAGKGHGRTGHAGTQFEPHTETHAKERGSFAQQLADYLNQGVTEQRCGALVLIATSPMLGALKPCLSKAASKMLRQCVAADLTHYQGPELKQRIDHALKLPD